MKIIQCEAGHFYDSDKYSECPHCKKDAPKELEKVIGNTSEGSSRHTQKLNEVDDVDPTMSNIERIKREVDSNKNLESVPQNKTTAPEKSNGPVYGWLVGLSESVYGKSFELYNTRNTIGSADDSMVYVESQTRSNIGVISFNEQDRMFYISPLNADVDVYVNDEKISENDCLNSRDIIRVEDSEFMFIPLVTEEFRWISSEEQALESLASGNTINLSDVIYDEAEDYIGDVYDENGDDVTQMLISSPWRCKACNALNSNPFNKCRRCGTEKD